VLSRVAPKIPRTLDFRDVTPDELVVLAQGPSVLDDLPLFRSGCFWPGYFQDQVMCFDDITVCGSIGIATLIIDTPCISNLRVDVRGIAGVMFDRTGTTGVILVPDAANVLVDLSLDQLDILSISPPMALSLTSSRTSACFPSAIPPLSSTFLFAPTTVVARPRSVQPE